MQSNGQTARLVDPSARKVLNSCRFLYPCVARFFSHRSNGLHRVGIVEQTDRHPGHGRVLRPAHIFGSAAIRAEELADHSAKVGGPIELPRLALDQNLRVRPVGGSTEW